MALATTLFIVASKSGGTIEIQSFEKHFWARVSALHGGDVAKTGAHFVAITDPATRLGTQAEEKKYRRTFVNAADIGGRYSALSYFGLVPAALLGIDVAALIDGGVELAAASSPHIAVGDMAPVRLGAAMGALAKRGRDKLTLIVDPPLASLGSWVEQLVAESTGKEGKGVIPVDLEPVGAPAAYGADRVFVHVALGNGDAALTASVAALEKAGHPVVRLRLDRREDLGREFFRWELATAVAGAVLGVNPFDEPNVTEAKVATSALLATQKEQGALPMPEHTFELGRDDHEAIRKHILAAGSGDYVALLAYFMRTDARDRLLTQLRVAAREKTHAATTLGYGPRFLHSTGQLHKGGPASGVFVQLTADVKQDLPIPGEAYSVRDLARRAGAG